MAPAGALMFSLSAAVSARAAAPRYPDILPLNQVKPGMVGYGLTTFKGSQISRFEVRVVGILKKANSGHDLILIRMKGGPITERGANLIQGMSGSPIYLNGRVAGAFSMGEAFPKEPVGMVTPIEDMLEAWDPNIPQEPAYYLPADRPSPPAAQRPGQTGTRWQPDHRQRTVLLPQPVRIGKRSISRLILDARADACCSSGDTAVLHRATSLVTVTGIREPLRAWLQKELDQRGYALTVAQGAVIGSSRSKPFRTAPLQPGSAFGTFLATGDVQFGGTGTVTYRRGSRILGFGHPLMGLGALEGAITSAYILDVFSGVQVSHHIAVAGPVIGALKQDRNFSVSADVGRMPHLVPFEVTVHDETNRRTQSFRSNLFLHPDLTPLLMRLVAREAISRVHSVPGAVMAKITTSVDAAEVGRITRSNQMFDSDDISAVSTQDLTEIMGIVSGNPFYPLPIQSARMEVTLSSGHNTATVERIFLKHGKYEPGDTLEVGVVLKPYRRDSVTRTVAIRIPSDTPTGRYQLLVRGGAPNVIRLGGLLLGGANPDPQTPPVNVQQMVARLTEREKNTDIVARLVFNTIAPALEGERLSQLPPHLSALMRSDRNSAVRLERDEIKTRVPSEYVVSGTQQLLVTVVRKNTQEPAGQPSFGAPPTLNIPGGGLTGPGGIPGFTGTAVLDLDPSPNDLPEAMKQREGVDRAGILPEMIGREPAERALTDPLLLRLHPETERWLHALSPDPKDQEKRPDRKPAEKRPKQERKPKGKTSTSSPTEEKPPAPPTVAPAPPAAVPTDSGPEKPVARVLQVWRQSARADFANGKFQGTAVTASGQLHITPTLRRLVSSSEIYIWSLAAGPQGDLYAGTGTAGKILKIDSQGGQRLFARLPAISVQCLLLARDGALWAGSGVKGELYRVAPDGSFTRVSTLAEKYILALAEDSKGNLYIAPGGGGTVYKLPAGAWSSSGNPPAPLQPFLKTSADHIMALTLDRDDNLYVGCGINGIVYKVTPNGRSTVLYDAKENAITALAVDGSGVLYAGTGPKGLLYRLTGAGAPAVIFDKATSFFTAMRAAPDGSLYACTVNAVYHILPSKGDSGQAVVLPLDNPKEVDFLTMAALPDGGMALGTGNVGEIYRTPQGEGRRSGSYESVVHDSRMPCRWGQARWDALARDGARARFETRSGDVAEPDSTWSEWSAVRQIAPNAMEGLITSPPGRFIQYRILLDAGDSATSADIRGHMPSVREISLSYMPRNQAPKVAFQAPAGGERWAKTQTLRWTGSDPDNDTLSYTLFYSNDGGQTWKPLPASPKTDPKTTGTVTAGSTPAQAGAKSLEELKQRLAADPDVPESIRALVLESAQRRLGVAADAAAATAAPSLRETSRAFDTALLPDGVYLLKIVASDQPSNPVDPQTAQAISDSFTVCNAVPKIALLSRRVLTANQSLVVEGTVTQQLIPVTAVQYRIDSGDWTAAIPRDGLFDAQHEEFAFVTPTLSKGTHTVEIVAFNGANGKTLEKITVEVP